MKPQLFLILFLNLLCFSLFAQTPVVDWQKCYGGSNGDAAYCITPTKDGGYIFAGITTSNDGDVDSTQGGSDIWVVKINIDGDIQWQKTYGGSSDERPYSISQTSDLGYVFIGKTKSRNGDITYNHSDSIYGYNDVWVVKIDYTGKIQWQKTYGGSRDEYGGKIVQTSDGGYIFVGTSSSIDGDLLGKNINDNDIWIVKLDSIGNIIWKKCIGGSWHDGSSSISVVRDGGYILGSASSSEEYNLSGDNGDYDAWIVRIDDFGNIIWQKCYGGTDHDSFLYAYQTLDKGYIGFGTTKSSDGDIVGSHGDGDFWCVKTDSIGNLQWQKCMGGSRTDLCLQGVVTKDTSYILVGATTSSDGDITSFLGGNWDAWLVKLDSKGNLLFEKCIGGTSTEFANDIIETSDGGFLISSDTYSNDGDVIGSHGSTEAWLVKFDGTIGIHNTKADEKILFYPNPTSNFIKFKNITFKNNFSEYIIYDSLQRVMQRGRVENDEINIISISPGVYFLQISEDANRMYKIIKY